MQEALQSCVMLWHNHPWDAQKEGKATQLPLWLTGPRLLRYISPRDSLISHCHITCVVYGMRMETRISSGLRQVFLYPTKKFESNVTVRLESVVDIVVTIHVYVSEVSVVCTWLYMYLLMPGWVWLHKPLAQGSSLILDWHYKYYLQ